MCFLVPRTSIQSPPSASTSRTFFSGLHQLALLVDDDAVQRLGQRDLALVGRQLAGQQLEQGRLARAVRPDDADPVAALDAQGEVRMMDAPLAEALGDLLGVDHRLGLGVVLGEAELGTPGPPIIAARCARISLSLASRPWLRRRRAVTPRCSQCSSSFSLASSFSARALSSA
jgi:hypothetical protein